MSKKSPYCPICKERLVKRQVAGKYIEAGGKLRHTNDYVLRFRHYCKKDERVILYPIWR